jgi:hypothetical protein
MQLDKKNSSLLLLLSRTILSSQKNFCANYVIRLIRTKGCCRS